MEGKLYYDYTLTQWIVFIVCYGVFFFFGGIESSESIYYSLMKSELQIPYRIQGWLVSMGSYSFILGSPIVGYLMTLVDVKPILILGFSFYIVAYLLLYFFKRLWIVFVSLFIEGIGAVLLDVGMNTLSTVLFPKHRGVMMNSLHFFYGVGCALGPPYSSRIFLVLKQGYRGIFLGLIAFAVIGFLLTVFTRLSLCAEAMEEEVVDDVESKLIMDGELSQPITEVNAITEANQSNSITLTSHSLPTTLPKTESTRSTAEKATPQHPALTLVHAFVTPMVWLLGLNMGARLRHRVRHGQLGPALPEGEVRHAAGARGHALRLSLLRVLHAGATGDRLRGRLARRCARHAGLQRAARAPLRRRLRTAA